MNSRHIYFVFSLLSVSALSTLAHPQVIVPANGKAIQAIPGYSDLGGVSNYQTDVTADSAGNRYVVGNIVVGDGKVNGYVLKFGKNGMAIYKKIITLGTVNLTTAVGVDSPTGRAYVAVKVDGHAHLVYFDVDGTQTIDAFVDVLPDINDIAVLPNGDVACAGTYLPAGATTPYFGVSLWQPQALGLKYDPVFVSSGTQSGLATSLVADNAGNIFAVGYSSQKGALYGECVIAGIKADFSGGRFSTPVAGTFAPNTNRRFTRCAMDKTTGMAVAVGYQANSTGGKRMPVVGVMDASFINGNNLGASFGWIDYSTMGYGMFSDVVAGADGSIVLSVTGGTTTGPRYVDVYGEKKSPTSMWFSDVWSDRIQATNPTKGLTAVNLAIADDNSVAALCADATPVGAGVTANKPYEVFTWASNGVRRQKFVLGPNAVNAPHPYDDAVMEGLGRLMFTTAGYLSVDAPSGLDGATGARWTGLFLPGPNDAFTGIEDTVLSVTAAKGLLINDGEGFDANPLSSVLHAGSLSSGLSSVSVASDGSFTATPKLNFNGPASFTYDVRRSGALVATHTVNMTFTSVNDAPTAVADSLQVTKNAKKVELNVTANDFDVDGDAFTITVKGTPAYGTVALSTDKLKLIYTPVTGFVGTDTLTYTIRDANGKTASAVVTIQVH